MKQKVIDITTNPMLNDEEVSKLLLKVLYEFNGSYTLTMFMELMEMEKQKVKAKNMLLYRGVESGMLGYTTIARALTENSTKRQANDYIKVASYGDNIAYMIDICKAYFPNGKATGASMNGVWYFNTFLKMVKKNRSKYEKGGDSYKWTKMMGHKEYLDIIFKVLDNKTKEKQDEY